MTLPALIPIPRGGGLLRLVTRETYEDLKRINELAETDMTAWLEQHRDCKCEALCHCEARQ